MNAASRLRILFAGTPDFAVPALTQLVTENFAPVAVFTQPDRPAGRGRQLQASPVKQAAIAAGMTVHQPVSLKNPAVAGLIAGLRPDLMIVVAYGLILPGEILDLPVHGCWNIHASLLPRWRGAAPIQRAIEAGDEKSGVCIMQMDAGLDTGPVIRRVSIPLSGAETGGELHDRLAGGNLSEKSAAAAKLEKREARIQWKEPAAVLERRIRAFNPWPVAWCMIDGERTRIWKAVCMTEHSEQEPGSVLAAGREGIDVATGELVIRLEELQRPGKRRMSAADYLNARSLPGRLDNGS